MRKKTRTGLTVLSIFIAFQMFGFLSAINDWLSGELVEGNYSERLIVQSTYGLPLPMAYFEKLKMIEGVVTDEINYNSFIGGYYQEQKNQFRQRAVKAESFLKMESSYYSLTPEEQRAWLQDKMGALVGRELANKYGWKVGDRIPLISSGHPRADNQPWQLNIRGILEHKREGLKSDFLVLHFDYLADGRGGIYDVFWYDLNVSDSRKIGEIIQRIDTEFLNSSRPTSTQTLSSLSSQFSSQFANFGLIASLILGAVFFTMLLVTGNTMLQAFYERIHELAVLRSIGFSGMALLYLIMAESLILVILGGLPGITLLWIVQEYLQTWFTGFYMRPVVVLQGVGIMLVMGLLVGLIPAIKARRLTIVDALRRR